MSYRRLDENGKPMPRSGRTSRREAVRKENDVDLYHYEIIGAVSLPGGGRRQFRQRFWLPDDAAADAKEREILHRAPADALTWEKAHRLWRDAHLSLRSPGHLAEVGATVRRWLSSIGARQGIEDTTLAAFSAWIAERAKTGTGRAAQLDRSHLLVIARWCRSMGLITTIQFEHARKPQDKTRKREPATVDQYRHILAVLPETMLYLWRLLALTGMRLGAACDLLGEDITDERLVVTTKGRAAKGRSRVPYSMTPEIREVVEGARAWKERAGRSGCPYLFCTGRGNRWTPITFGKRLRKVIEANNMKVAKTGEGVAIPRVTSHQLRHMAGTALGERNFAIPQIMAALGQSHPASAKVYVDQTRKMRDAALEAVADFLQIADTKTAELLEIARNALNRKKPLKVSIKCPCCNRNFNQFIKIKTQPS